MPEACNNCFLDPHNWFTKPERSDNPCGQPLGSLWAVQLGHNLKQFSSYFIFWPTISLYIFTGSVSYLPYRFCKKQRIWKTTDFIKQQISINNRFQKTTNIKNQFQKQQISKNNRFQEINFKKEQIKKQQISTTSYFQIQQIAKVTDSKKQQISKNNRFQKTDFKHNKFQKTTNFKKTNFKNNRLKNRLKNNSPPAPN